MCRCPADIAADGQIVGRLEFKPAADGGTDQVLGGKGLCHRRRTKERRTRRRDREAAGARSDAARDRAVGLSVTEAKVEA